MEYTYASNTDIGPNRKINQDCFGVVEKEWGNLFIVSDGFGHEKGGIFASRASVDLFLEEFSKESPKDIKKFIVNTFKRINKHIYYHKVSEFQKAMLGCTSVVIIFQDYMAYVAHIGDSRAYLVRDNNLSQLTKDHSYIQTLIDEGKVTIEKAQLHPKKHVLSKALGSHINPTPSYTSVEIKSDDKFILCSDGVWGFISDNIFLDIVDKNEVSKAVERITNHIVIDNGLDNITLQLIHFK
jgi:protein phosphatase